MRNETAFRTYFSNSNISEWGVNPEKQARKPWRNHFSPSTMEGSTFRRYSAPFATTRPPSRTTW